jgi:hypothetical protein
MQVTTQDSTVTCNNAVQLINQLNNDAECCMLYAVRRRSKGTLPLCRFVCDGTRLELTFLGLAT